MRRTLQQALNSRLCESLNLDPSDPRVVSYINMATERVLHRGHFVGTVQHYNVSVTSQLLTLPPQFVNIERFAVNQCPVVVRDFWYGWSRNSWGLPKDTSIQDQCQLRGNYPGFLDIVPGGKKIRAQCDVADDVGVKVTFYGYDDSGNWIRTKVSGVWQDGETVALAQSPGTLTTNNFSVFKDMQKPVTNGQMWAYQWDGAANVLIGQYQYWETNPSYPRFLIPVLPNIPAVVDLRGKIAFYPVANPSDYLIIGHLEALRLACMSVKAEEEHNFTEAALLMNGKKDNSGQTIVEGAITLLQSELQHVQGDGYKPSLELELSAVDGSCVETLM